MGGSAHSNRRSSEYRVESTRPRGRAHSNKGSSEYSVESTRPRGSAHSNKGSSEYRVESTRPREKRERKGRTRDESFRRRGGLWLTSRPKTHSKPYKKEATTQK